MPLRFTQLSMTELRTRPGEILDRTSSDGEAFIIERNGQRKACLVPLSFFLPDISPTRLAEEMEELDEQGADSRPLINEDREFVFRFGHSLGDNTQVVLSVVLPHGYPNKCPRVYASPIDEASPHVWADGG
ncbi:MAG: type II toxin-antitoxin system Phd/YefM family antitoxin, partial [Planctomycetes bacterium]|nr:type II toxin-antitoxin system Phd/YefM family antitoxin [Planctomycetota bacterium]